MATLFDKAKGKSEAKPSAKNSKDEVVITSEVDFQSIKRLEELKASIAELEAEQAIVYGSVRSLGVNEFNRKYELGKKYTESFKIVVKDPNSKDTAVFMLAPTDKYLKIDEDKATLLKNKYGEQIVAEETTFAFDNDMLDKYGEAISKMIENSTEIDEADKSRLIKASTKLAVRKGTIKEFRSNDEMRKFSVEELVNDVQPIFQVKAPKIEVAE